jgi:hypothetical protein
MKVLIIINLELFENITSFLYSICNFDFVVVIVIVQM